MKQTSPQRKDKIVKDYIATMSRMMRYNYPQLSKQELEDSIAYSIQKRYRQEDAQIYNNYKEKTVDMTLYEIVNYIMEREPIMTAYGVLFHNHGKVPNPLSKLFQTFLDKRNLDKKKMFSFPPGSEEYERYNLFQLLDKLDANGLYGALGAVSCLMYNVHVASSITTQARSSISAAIMFFEMMLNDNVKFRSLNEVIAFIDNILTETKERYKENNSYYMELTHVTPVECLGKIAKTCDYLAWTPTDDEIQVIWDILNRITQDELDRIYYKNNLYKFMDNYQMTNAIKNLLNSLSRPFLDPNEPPEEIKVELDIFEDMIREYVFYKYQVIDRIDRNIEMIKSVTILSDTDSAIVNLDGWYRYVLDKVRGENLPVTHMQLDAITVYDRDEFGDLVDDSKKEIFPRQAIEIIDNTELDYDFYNDEVIEMERSIDPVKIIPQDGLRYSIINIIAYCLGNLVNEYMNRYCDLNNSNKNSPTKCRLILKNEFLFKSVILTNAKKHYATIQELREGHNNHNQLDIKGLEMDKTTLNPTVQKAMKKILYEDILNIDNIDQILIMKKIAILEKQIFKSLEEGKKDFYKPLKTKPINKYPDPMRIQGIKASVVWNNIKDDDLISINLDDSNSIDIAKVDINTKNIDVIREEFPSTYEKISTLLKNPLYKGQITSLAIPKDVEIPEWVKEFIDYNTIINDNISSFPFESIGLTRNAAVKNNNVNYTNILTL